MDAPRTYIAALPIVALSRSEWIAVMKADCSAPRDGRMPKLFSSANGNVVSLYHYDSAFRKNMDAMHGIDADGMPLVIASRILSGLRLPERVATTDFFHDAAQMAERNRFRFYLLGGTVEENERALFNVRRMYPGLMIGGRSGYFPDSSRRDVIEEILAFETDVLWVGLGVPQEQAFVVGNAPYLSGVAWVKTCGGLVNFLSGTNRRAPTWVQRVGFEWAYRLMLEPRRLGWRYLITNPRALYLFFRHRT